MAVPHTYRGPLPRHFWNRGRRWCQECAIDSWLFPSRNTTSRTSYGRREKGTEVRRERDYASHSKLLQDVSINHLCCHHPFLTHSPLSRSSIFVLVSKLPKIPPTHPLLNLKSAHPFHWQHTPHTVKSKITSKSCFAFQIWRLYYNQLPARRRVRLLHYNQKKNTQQFLGTALVSHLHRSEVLL